MGEVWLAERTDRQLKRPVALKLPMLGIRRVMVERFARERDILGSLVHLNIARLYDAGLTDSGQPYMALEYVQGTTLTAYCDGRRLNTAQRLALVMQVADARSQNFAAPPTQRGKFPESTPDLRRTALFS
jgi:serine/threonine-protein kinase